MKCKNVAKKDLLKLLIVALCLIGFIMQTAEFLLLYWTYPTVVDIQQAIVSETDMPGISFCNSNGIDPSVFCRLKALCFPFYILQYIKICPTYPEVCSQSGELPRNFKMVTYHSFLRENDLNQTVLDMIRKDVPEFLSCKIVRGTKEYDCDVATSNHVILFFPGNNDSLDNILIGSYFSDTTMFNLCYTINSRWGNPKRKIPKIGKYDKIIMDFFVDMSSRGRAPTSDTIQFPRFNLPSFSPSIQIAVHSPYLSVSPYASGYGILGGKNYKIKLQMEVKHLLPPPYQTNCTDYMPDWYARGGIGPLNQLMVMEECKFNKTLELKGCVPFSIDYPHNETVCRHCSNCSELSTIADDCSVLLDLYNQPCDFTTYEMKVEESNVFVEKTLKNNITGGNESLVFVQKGFNCKGDAKWSQKCNEIRVEIVFDDFLVTNYTYNPKIENLELFSVIGGYMGMYLGVSFVTVYDLGEWITVKLRTVRKVKRKQMNKKRIRKNKVSVGNERSSIFLRRNANYEFMQTHW